MADLPVVSQRLWAAHRLNSRRPLKLFSCEAFPEYMVSCFFDPVRNWSLDACFGRALPEGRFDRSEMVCTKILYRYVNPGLLPVKNIDLPQKLRRKTAGTRTRKHRVLFGHSRTPSWKDSPGFGKNTGKRLRRSFVPSSVITAGNFTGCRN